MSHNMSLRGYYRFPHVFRDQIAFVSEDDLWLVSSEGGRAERLTTCVGKVSHPCFSPTGEQIAFVGCEEGPKEVYVMATSGGNPKRLTYQAGECKVICWSPDGTEILFATSAGQFTKGFLVIEAVKSTGGLPRQIPVGMANTLSYGPHGEIVIGRDTTTDYAYWQRYRGGRIGQLWCDLMGQGSFKHLLPLEGNLTCPCWVGARIYFLSDHDGCGNLYSCTPLGENVQQHTNHRDFYARHLASDGLRLVYQAGADLYLFDPRKDRLDHLEILFPTSQSQRNRKFVAANWDLDTYALHPKGHSVALTTRGKAFSMGNWEGPVLQHGNVDGVRYRFLEWLNDGIRMVAITDAPGREALIIFNPEDANEQTNLNEIDFGRATHLAVSPTDDQVAMTNHRNEVMIIDIKKGTGHVLDRSPARHIRDMSWSPDGQWLAYDFPLSSSQSAIKLCHVQNRETYQVTEPVLDDFSPWFDPEGKFLYFLGERMFNPVHDNLHFALSFPKGVKPYVMLLQKNLQSPFIQVPRALGEDEKKDEEKQNETENKQKELLTTETTTAESNGQATEKKRGEPITIDLDGITERILPFPSDEGCFHMVRGIKGKALFLSFPVEGALDDSSDTHGSKGRIDAYDFKKYKKEHLIDNVSSFHLSRDHTTLIYSAGGHLRVLKAGEEASNDDEKETNRQTGWLSLKRVKVSVHPGGEWKQMFAEAWRLQREQFWSADMAGIDWDAVYALYVPLVERVNSRSELSDLILLLQGALGTSHTYEIGGDYPESPNYSQGFMGVDWQYDSEKNRYRIARIIKGDPSESRSTSPLTGPGLHIAVGDAVLAVNRQRVGVGQSPQEFLVNQAGNEVQLMLENAGTAETRIISVKALSNEYPARYREWVKQNRQMVREHTEGRVGYIHIPTMMEDGYGEFCRAYLAHYDCPALIIDVRWNSGGYVAPLVLDLLTRKRIGYEYGRWSLPIPYPDAAPQGRIVVLCNEATASDAEVFCQSLKERQLGLLVGTRTWGGVIAYSPRHDLVDGTKTTQPEYPIWFQTAGWGIENYGVTPDIEIVITPQDYQSGTDPQLQRAITEALSLIKNAPSLEPKLLRVSLQQDT